LGSGTVAAQEAAEPSGSRARLEQQLQAQLAANEALKARIAKLEAALKGDVCADPAAVEALLKDAPAATPPAGGAPAGGAPPAQAPGSPPAAAPAPAR
jgi:hypothetical protein